MNNETISMLEFLDEHDLELNHLSNTINLINNVLCDIDDRTDYTFDRLDEVFSLLHFCKNSIESLKRSAAMFWEYYWYVEKCGLDKITLTRYLDCITACEISEAPVKEGDKDIKAGIIAYLKRLTNERQPEQSKPAAV